MVFSAFGYEPLEIASIYIGGGTPSLIPSKLLERWLTHLRAYINFVPDFEFTVEANPESLSSEICHDLYDLSVNRIVIGVQSFSPAPLRQLGRRVRTKDIYQAFYNARSAGLENIGGDLIFGLPGQKIKNLRTDIDRLTALDPQHISLYQLTVEQNTKLAEMIADGEITLPDEDTCAAMYRIGSHILIDRGYQRYEVSNFARGGFASRHNLAYWTDHPYIGLGPAANGYIHGVRYANIADLDRYYELTESGRSAVAFTERLTDDQKLMEKIMLSLRMADGIDRRGLIDSFGKKGEKILESPAVRRLIRGGFMVNDAGFLRLTDNGFLLADKIIAELV